MVSSELAMLTLVKYKNEFESWCDAVEHGENLISYGITAYDKKLVNSNPDFYNYYLQGKVAALSFICGGVWPDDEGGD